MMNCGTAVSFDCSFFCSLSLWERAGVRGTT